MSCQLVEAGIVLKLVICGPNHSFSKYSLSIYTLLGPEGKLVTCTSQDKVFVLIELILWWGAEGIMK